MIMKSMKVFDNILLKSPRLWKTVRLSTCLEITEDIILLLVPNSKYVKSLEFGGDCRPFGKEYINLVIQNFSCVERLILDRNNCVSDCSFILQMKKLTVLSLVDCFNISENNLVCNLKSVTLKYLNVANLEGLTPNGLILIGSNCPVLEVLNCAWCCEWTAEEGLILVARAKNLKCLTITPRPYNNSPLWATIVHNNKHIDFCNEVLHMVPPTQRPYGHNLPSIMDDLWLKGLV